MPSLLVGDIQVAYTSTGSGPLVVLLHGQGGRGDAFSLQQAAFAGRYRVVCPDLRGHGGSSVTPGPYHMSQLAADVAGLCRALGPCHLLGHSLGGMVALQLALDFPDVARSLAVVNSAAYGHGSFLRTSVIRAYIRWRGMAAFARQNARLHLPAPEQEDLRRRMVAIMGSCPADGYLAAQAAVDRFDVRGRLAEIACPVLVVHSEDDLIPLADKEQVARQVPRARLVTIPRSRHLVVWDQPEALASACTAFWAEMEGTPRPALRTEPPAPDRRSP